jgi:two-component system, chemotaxis family, protein-glutamate methylesterase/glutaminase
MGRYGKVKVLIIDDSALVREILSKGLNGDPDIEVVGTAPDVYIARDKIVFKKPDVLTLDVEMPRMDGVEFLKRLMPQYPIPVVMVSAMTGPGAKTTLEALESGAVDFVLKPSTSFGGGLNDMIEDLRAKVKAAARADVSAWRHRKAGAARPKTAVVSQRVLEGSTDKVIAIGASTGGTNAIREVIMRYPADMPGTVIVQHMPPKFTEMFAEKLNEASRVEVKEAKSGDRIVTGRVLIAPGGYHMSIIRSGGNYLVDCKAGEKVNGHCPSVEVLFQSAAKHVGVNAIGVILTGMGRDGADALKEMRGAGARTFAQDEKTSVIFGMPGEAWKIGAAEKLVGIFDVTDTIIQALKEMK